MTVGSLILGMLGGALVVIIPGYIRWWLNVRKLRRIQQDIKRRLRGGS